jgi:hypothetical protein
VIYLTKAAIPTIEIDYLLNFTTSLPFLLLLLASTQQPMFKGIAAQVLKQGKGSATRAKKARARPGSSEKEPRALIGRISKYTNN